MPRSRRAVLTLSLCLATLPASALGAGAAHAAAWLPGPTLTQSSVYAPPQTAIGADDGALVLTTEIDTFGSPIPSVVVRRLAPDGAQLAQLTIGKGYGVDAVALPGGGYRIAWVSPGPPTNQLVLATVDAAGRVSGVRPATSVEAISGPPVGAVAANGSAVLAYNPQPGPGDPRRLRVLQVAADGGAAPIADLGPVAPNSTALQLVRANDGSARLLWERPAPGNTVEQMVGRVSAAGVGTSAVLDDAVVADTAELVVGGGDPIVSWLAPGNVANSGDVLVSRLPSSGPIGGAATTVATGISAIGGSVDVAVAADGTATVVWPRFEPSTVTSSLHSRQFTPSGALGPEREISPPTGFVELDATPRVRIGRNGTMVVQWFRGFPAVDAQLKGLSKVLDSSGAAAGPELPVPYTLPLAAILSPGVVDVTVAPSGTGLLVGAAPTGGPASALLTARFDSTPPTLVPTLPATAVRGTAAAFAAGATDGSGIAKITWQFGDGASADGADVTHVYGAAGPQTVTVTATDAAGESTSVTRGIAVSDPPPGPAATPTPSPGPSLASAKLRVTKATRKGARVTVSGTIDRRARGQVSVTWSQKSGRKTVKRTVRAKIKKGRFSATIKLSRALARSRVAGRLSVTYAGDRVLRRTTVTRSVKAPAR
ncbi:PKD domain-containing protein [Solirubrobacter pauli]|uniref:PKD domain-containing protein n=1 Tax=Solirubrobacter pauli TaxID=166793 RepID=A0A660L195_9ACTN|nr:PKD domain-containing protein [Solirubrobacter pauli]RKQ86984.1 PKD domain-containing protein [Solirubrobacter pauli]